jgi:hypothetical protein
VCNVTDLSNTDTFRNFRKGATTFKNAIDLTRGYRNAAIAHANEVEEEEEQEARVHSFAYETFIFIKKHLPRQGLFCPALHGYVHSK